MANVSPTNLTVAHPGAAPALSTAAAVRPAALSEVMFRIYRQPPMLAASATPSPLLSDFQETQLKATPTKGQTPIQDFTVGSSKLRPLATWLADPATALVQCARDSLLITMRAVADSSIQLFPLSGQITASLANLPGSSAAHPLTVASFDPAERRLVLSLPFSADAAGEALYESLITAMQDHASTLGVTLSYAHLYAVMVTPRPFIDPYRVYPTATARPALAASALRTAEVTRVMTPRPPYRPMPHPAPPPAHPPAPPPHPPTPTPTPQPQRQERSAALQFTFSIFRPRDSQPDPYPGLPKSDSVKTWSSWVDPNDQDNIDLRVYFKSSDSPDQFFYLPTSYKLGFFADDQGGLQAPISAQNYLKGDDYRVKVKLVALPYIDDAVREKVRAYICTQVLNGVLPFVQLIPAAGIDCKFASDIVPISDSSTSGQNLPASIQFTAGDNLEPDKRLTFEFDMNAFDYALFGEILKHGIRGTLLVQDGAGFKQGVDVSMKLGEGEVIANSLDFKVDPDTSKNTVQVTLNNRLDFPVDLTSARAFFTKYASQIDGLVFKSESSTFLPAQNQTSAAFAEKGKDQASVVLTLTPSSSDWNQVGIVLGAATVKAGSAEDWLNRVNEDPSLQPQRFKIHADLIVPDAAKQVIQVIEIKLYRDGDPASRKDVQLLPSSAGADLTVEMTLTELMGSAGKQATFSIEYYTVYLDGSLGLPQRLALDLTTADLIVTALSETPVSLYTLVYDDETGERRVPGDRASTTTAINHLRDAGAHWRLFARGPTPEDSALATPAGPAG
jgi:hypothetical protein